MSSKSPIRYRIARLFIRMTLSLYYRSVEVYGKNFFPRRGRTLIIANHQTGLIDGILIIATNNITIRTLIKHTLWEQPLIAFFANSLGLIPVMRKQDLPEADAAQPGKNRHEKTFERVEQTFLSNESALIFPEGKSHDISYLQKLRSGAARMLLQIESKHDFRLDLRWLPISLDYEEKDRPGSRVLLHYHPSREIAKYKEIYAQDSEKAVALLRTEMEDYLSEITLNFATWEDRLFVERLTEMWLACTPTSQLLDRHNQLLKWKRVMEKTQLESAQDWAKLRKLVEKLHGHLTDSALQPKEIFKADEKSRRFAFSRIFSKMLFWAIPILFGRFLWWVPTTFIRYITIKGAKQNRDVVSTYHLVAACIIYPAWLLIFASIVGWFSSAWINTAFLILGISSGLSWLLVPRRMRTELRAALNIYRAGSLEKVIEESRVQIHEIWQLAARLWNMGLRRQVMIESLEKNEA